MNPVHESRLRPVTVALIAGAVALAYRVLLTRVYWGQEEGDYGNLGLILGTVESGFRYVETEHMPMYTWLSAAVCALVGDAHLAGLLVSLTFGTATVVLVTWGASRWLGATTGAITGLVLGFQPDLALLSATTLRGATYTGLLAACVLAAASRRWVLAGLLFWPAFLTRFDAMATVLPLLALGAALDRDTSRARRVVGIGLAASVVPAWAALYSSLEGTARFWAGAVGRNTGTTGELSLAARLGKGLEALVDVGRYMLPDHLGAALLALAPLGVVILLRGEARDPARGRMAGLLAATTGGFFAATVVLSAYRWDHNLYWSWLGVAAPFVLPAAVHGGVALVRALPRGRALAVVALVAATALPFYRQTWQQVLRSEQWLGTQVRFTRWLDRELPPDAVILADLIPATWLGRRSGSRTVLRWSQEDVPAGDPAALGAWLDDHDVGAVIWFREEWVGAAERAPWLGEPGRIAAGPVVLEAVAKEDGYGFVAWLVTDGGAPPRPPLAAGRWPRREGR